MQRSNYAYSNGGYSDLVDNSTEMKIQKPIPNGIKVEEGNREKTGKSPTFVSKAGPFFLPRFIVEVLAVAALSALAYYLRFNDGPIFAPYIYPIPCQKVTIVASVYVVPYTVTREVFLFVLFAAPIVVFLLGESIRWGLSVIATKSVMIGKLPVGQSLRRTVRIVGCFYTGIILTSIITDMLQLFISRPSPTFINNCLENSACPSDGFITINNCVQKDNATVMYQLYNELRAFPSYRATMSAFAATYAGWYVHFLFEARGSFVLRPFLATGCVALAMMPSLSDWAQLKVNWEDVAVGLAIGVLIGIYMVANVNWFVEAHDEDIMKLATLQAVIKKQTETADMVNYPGNYVREPPLRRLLPRIQAVNTSVIRTPASSPTPTPSYYQNGLQRSNTMPLNKNPDMAANDYNNRNMIQRQSQQPPIYAYGTSTF